MRSSWMLEVSGIPYRKNEDCQQLIQKIVELTNITNFHVAQIDVLHRTSTRENAQIIILFNKKRDGMNFFRQSHKLKSVAESQFVEACESNEDREGTLIRNTPKEQQQRFIYLNESFSQENRKLLKEVRDKSRAKKYIKYKEYTVNGQVRVRKTDTNDVIYITCMADLSKII